MFDRLIKDTKAFVDVGVGISIGILFAGLMVIAYIIWTLQDQLGATGAAANFIANITGGFDNTINLLLIVVVIWLLALAIMALLIIKKRAG